MDKTIFIDFTNKNNTTFCIDKIKGFIKITQKNKNNPTHFKINISGLKPNKLHGFHIHENPIINELDLEKTCNSCGGHFNPTNKNHGSRFNDNSDDRHVGDLINNLKADNDGFCIIEFDDDDACLIPSKKNPYTIIGKSIVIHSLPDDLGREGLDKDMPYLIYNKITDSNYIINIENKNIKNRNKYKKKSKKQASKINGNAGRRIACANI